ncbi:MAG TPA: glycosyltransferase [Fibrobacteraceae bacterium]|nr:glycosyltransferase [Fibrobacteraceae bacterium]
MIFLSILFGLIAVGYAALDLALAYGLLHLRRTNAISSRPQVSVLICARNEETHLDACLKSVLTQDYDGEWEVRVADDRSEDRTPTVLKKWDKDYPQKLHLLRIDELPTGLSPKKNAITRLVPGAAGEILLFTDADCVVSPSWITGMVSCFRDGVDWVSGYSRFPAEGRFHSLLYGFQAVDFLSHRTVDAAGIGWGHPITACGQNLAYRKSVFEELHGFAGVEHVVSGDDDLLMHKLAALRPNAIAYCIDPATFVDSAPQHSWKRVWEQRKRWASKTVNYNWGTVLLLGPVFLFYLGILLGLVIGAILWGLVGFWIPLWLAASLLLWKTLCDTFVMILGIRLFREQRLWRWYPFTALLHIPMIVGAVLAGVFGGFTWKDQGTGRCANSPG